MGATILTCFRHLRMSLKYSPKLSLRVFPSFVSLALPLLFFEPVGPSPIGARLDFVLKKIIDQLEKSKTNAAAYGKVKPVNIVVLTNSLPSDDPLKIIQSAAKKLREGLHHPNAVSILFAQLASGDDTHVEKALKKLVDDSSVVRDSSCIHKTSSDLFSYRIWLILSNWELNSLLRICRRLFLEQRIPLYVPSSPVQGNTLLLPSPSYCESVLTVPGFVLPSITLYLLALLNNLIFLSFIFQ
jgi:hypothetical protein